MSAYATNRNRSLVRAVLSATNFSSCYATLGRHFAAEICDEGNTAADVQQKEQNFLTVTTKYELLEAAYSIWSHYIYDHTTRSRYPSVEPKLESRRVSINNVMSDERVVILADKLLGLSSLLSLKYPRHFGLRHKGMHYRALSSRVFVPSTDSNHLKQI